jgi:filamentous hemagglutinin
VQHPPVATSQSLGPVREWEVGKFKDLRGRAVTGDDLTPDHIPSYAALKKAKEIQYGRKLTPAEAKAVRDEANAMMVRTKLHQEGRTFGGKNTEAKITEDACDLGCAAEKDTAQHLKSLESEPDRLGQAAKAAEELRKRNKDSGIH